MAKAVAAALPILVILSLMLGLRWSAARAGLVGLAVTGLLAVGVFDFPAALGPTMGAATAAGGVVAEALFTSATILWIVGPALGIYELQNRTGANDVLRDGLARLSPNPRLLALLVAWFFALFMEGAAGFGTAAALAAPFLVSVGFKPLTAVVAAMLGHSVGVSFGAVGTPIVPQVAATGLTGLELARSTGIYHSVLGWIPLAAAMLLVVRATSGREERAATAAWTAAAAVAFLVPFTLLSQLVGPELPTLGGALFGGMAFVALLLVARRRAASRPGADEASASSAGPPLPALLRAASPYLVLVVLVLVTRLVPGLQTFLRGVELAWSFADFSGSVAPLYHPGTMLLIGFLAGAAVQPDAGERSRDAVVAATGRLAPVAVALVSLLALSRLMVHAGMIDVLAEGAAAGTGASWPVFAPLVGALGTFVTGSATASNILFTDLQQATASQLGLPVAPLVGAQGFGAAIGNAICPHNIVAASATVSLTGKEGQVIRHTLGVTILYALLGGLLALLLV